MMRRVGFLLFLMFITSSIFASTFIFDRAFMLTIKEEEYLEERLENSSSKAGFSIFVLTDYTTNGLTSNEYCENFFQENERDGIALFINTESMEYLVSFTSSIESSLDLSTLTINDLNNAFYTKLSNGEFVEAFTSFADFVVENAERKEEEKGFEYEHISEKRIVTYWVIILIISLLIGYFSMSSVVVKMEERQKLKSCIRNADNEATYKAITNKSDELLYSNTSSRPRGKIIILRIILDLLR